MGDRADDAALGLTDTSATEPSRRPLLKSGAGVLAAAAAAPTVALAQGAAPAANDPELARLLAQPRILIKGGLVLTLDRQLGDFARADVLIEDGKIREVRPDIAVSTDAA